MSTSLYAQQEADFRFKGDYVLVDGTLTTVGDFSATSACTLGAASKTVAIAGPATVAGTLSAVGTFSATNACTLGATAKTVAVAGPMTIAGAVTTLTATTAVVTTFALAGAASGTTAGAVWTSGAPALTAGQKYLLVTLGGASGTAYRIPVFDNA